MNGAPNALLPPADAIGFTLPCDMDPLLISAATGMKARMEWLDMLANNIANAGTIGFKADREFYGVLEAGLFQTPASAAATGSDALAGGSPAGSGQASLATVLLGD